MVISILLRFVKSSSKAYINSKVRNDDQTAGKSLFFSWVYAINDEKLLKEKQKETIDTLRVTILR